MGAGRPFRWARALLPGRPGPNVAATAASAPPSASAPRSGSRPRSRSRSVLPPQHRRPQHPLRVVVGRLDSLVEGERPQRRFHRQQFPTHRRRLGVAAHAAEPQDDAHVLASQPTRVRNVRRRSVPSRTRCHQWNSRSDRASNSSPMGRPALSRSIMARKSRRR